MTEFTPLFEVVLGPKHSATGKTKHYADDKLLPPPHALRIERADKDTFYLVYLNQELSEQTNTRHDSLESAFEQATWEFQVQPDEWKRL